MFILMGAAALQACQLGEKSETKVAAHQTFRQGMGTTPTQCDSSQTMGMRLTSNPIAGVDNATYGVDHDGPRGPNCGKCVTVKWDDNFTQDFEIRDRIWQNGGEGSQHYSDSGSSSDLRPDGDGYTQIDIDEQWAKDHGRIHNSIVDMSEPRDCQ